MYIYFYLCDCCTVSVCKRAIASAYFMHSEYARCTEMIKFMCLFFQGMRHVHRAVHGGLKQMALYSESTRYVFRQGNQQDPVGTCKKLVRLCPGLAYSGKGWKTQARDRTHTQDSHRNRLSLCSYKQGWSWIRLTKPIKNAFLTPGIRMAAGHIISCSTGLSQQTQDLALWSVYTQVLCLAVLCACAPSVWWDQQCANRPESAWDRWVQKHLQKPSWSVRPLSCVLLITTKL